LEYVVFAFRHYATPFNTTTAAHHLNPPRRTYTHPFTVELPPQDGRCVGVFLWKNLHPVGNHGHLAAEALERLGELATDGSRAYDQQPAGQFGECEDRFIGVVAALLQTRNRRLRGSHAGGDDGAVKLDAAAIDCDRGWTHKTGVAHENVHAELGKPLHGVVLTDAGA